MVTTMSACFAGASSSCRESPAETNGCCYAQSMFNALRRLLKRDSPPPSSVARTEQPDEPRVRITTTVERRPRPGPTPPSERSTVYSSEYLPREQEVGVIGEDEDGRVNLRLEPVRDLLVLTAPGGEWIYPFSPTLCRFGITVFKLRGASHYEAAVKAGDFSPGTPVRLVREPDNEHDPNAIAVYAIDGKGPAGYVNKQNAARLAKMIDSGEPLEAIAIRGAKPGEDGVPVMVLVADPGTMKSLREPR